ncbi:peptide chain release factor N(5)-glutamine methyltransferase [Lysinibacter cavernae]|nr:peptide chain release factor N(5)-glutamine methyltransferase [Lysinibacter cavernae]
MRALVEAVVARLTDAGIPDPQVDAELLLGHVLNESRGRVQALSIMDVAVDDDARTALAPLVARRATREPLQHITGTAAFRSLTLNVGPGVFVPRPETESVVQFAIDALRALPAAEPVAVDLGTGSGAIALAMAVEVPTARVYAVEMSDDAFPWTRRNFDEVAAPNAELIHGDLEHAVDHLAGTVNVLISNPPYIPAAAIPRDPEVRLFDPEVALYGGEDGLDVVRTVSQVGLRLVVQGGVLVLEHGELQGDAIRTLLAQDGWRSPETHKDLTYRDRTTTAIR